MSESMTGIVCTREQRRVVRNAMGLVKLMSPCMNPPERMNVDRDMFCTLVRYAHMLDHLCVSEKIIEEEPRQDAQEQATPDNA